LSQDVNATSADLPPLLIANGAINLLVSQCNALTVLRATCVSFCVTFVRMIAPDRSAITISADFLFSISGMLRKNPAAAVLAVLRFVFLFLSLINYFRFNCVSYLSS
jgi:hypothetical protein